jgi:hypothetical protein
MGQIARTLRPMGRAAMSVVPDLIEAIRQSGDAISNVSTIDGDRGVLGTLVAIGGTDEAVISFLRSELSDSHPSVRLDSAARLIDVDIDIEQVIATLVGEMEHPSNLGGPYVGLTCGAAARLLARLGTRASDAMESVAALLESGHTEQEFSAAFVIASIADSCEAGGKNHAAAVRAVQPLIRLLDSKDGFTRLAAVKALGALGPVAAPAISSLEAARHERRNAVAFRNNPYTGGFSETDYVSPIFVKAGRSKHGEFSTIADEIQAALGKISAD